MEKFLSRVMAVIALALVMAGCGKNPETIVNDAYKSASENTFEHIAAYVLPDSIESFSETEVQAFAEYVRAGVGVDSYASFVVDSVVVNPEGTQANFVVKTNFKDGKSYTETGQLRKTAKGSWRLMVDKEATDSVAPYSESDSEKLTPELMRNLHYATIMTLASRGLPQYQVMAADIVKEGIFTGKDDQRAFDLLKSAAEKNYVPAYRPIAAMYEKGGKGIEKDYEKSFEWYQKAADAGDTKAYQNVAYAYREGKGTMKDYAKAKEWYEKGIEAGDPTSYRLLGYMYCPEFKGFENDLGKAFDLWTKGYQAALKSGDKKEAAANANNIGACYGDGWGVAKDVKKQIEWYTKAAETGDETAMKNLGETYYFGRGVPKDYDKAFYWLSKADKAGELYARYLVGECYEYGRSVDMNKTKAKNIYFELWNKHSDQNGRRGYERLYDY